MGFTRPGSEDTVAVADTQDMAQYRVTIEESTSGGYLPIILTTTPSTAATQQESKTSRRGYAKRAVFCRYYALTQSRARTPEFFNESQSIKLSHWNHDSACKGSGDALLRCRRGRGRGPR